MNFSEDKTIIFMTRLNWFKNSEIDVSYDWKNDVWCKDWFSSIFEIGFNRFSDVNWYECFVSYTSNSYPLK